MSTLADLADAGDLEKTAQNRFKTTKSFVLPKNLTIKAKETLTLSVKTTITVPDGKAIINNGTIIYVDDNDGSWATIDNYGTICNNVTDAVITIDLGSITNNYGTIENKGTIDNYGTIENKSGGEIINHKQIVNYGNINNNTDGTITNYATIWNNIIYEYSGKITNYYGATISNMGGVIINYYDATISNEDGGEIINNVNGENNGKITSVGTIANTGTITNFETCEIIIDTDDEGSGAIKNNGEIINTGTITITNNDGGIITNNKTITNNGTITNNKTITNNGTITNNKTITCSGEGCIGGTGAMPINTDCPVCNTPSKPKPQNKPKKQKKFYWVINNATGCKRKCYY